MTERQGRKPGETDQARLSADDVERRLVGGAGIGGPVEPQTPPTPPLASGPTARSGRRRLVWRDAALAVTLLAFLALGARFALDSQPTGSEATATPAASEVALASASPAATATVVPLPTPSPTPFQVIPSLATATPVPTPTPKPTPTPVVTPPPTPKPTPTPPPPTATLKVSVVVAGGANNASDWTVTVTGASATPKTFPGAASTSVKIRAGQSYTVTTSGPTGYTEGRSPECGPGASASAGATVICSFIEESASGSGPVRASATWSWSAPTILLPVVGRRPKGVRGARSAR